MLTWVYDVLDVSLSILYSMDIGSAISPLKWTSLTKMCTFLLLSSQQKYFGLFSLSHGERPSCMDCVTIIIMSFRSYKTFIFFLVLVIFCIYFSVLKEKNTMSTPDPRLQIRKLPYRIHHELSRLLDIPGDKDWSALISVLPDGMYSRREVKFKTQC